MIIKLIEILDLERNHSLIFKTQTILNEKQ